MADITANLGLPLLLAGQAQKHVTHNEALAIVDLLVQGVVQDIHRTSPPDDPAQGQCHIVAAAPTGIWAGQAGRIAGFVNGGWIFIAPRDGWRMSLPNGDLLRFADGIWHPASSQPLQVGAIGINAAADATNGLALSAPASLLRHKGAGHQLKINKAAMGETASLLFQSNWSGRAEMGLMGQDDFAIKLSADGSSFIDALRLSRSSGVASGAAVAESAADTTATLNWTFPAAFVTGGTVVVQLSAQDGNPGSSGLRLGYNNLTVAGCDLTLYRTAAIATELAAIAIGRWV